MTKVKDYDIRTVQRGDKIPVYCDHEGCKRYLVMVVNNPSTMECYCPRHKASFDMRNQVWQCHQHATYQFRTHNKVNP